MDQSSGSQMAGWKEGEGRGRKGSGGKDCRDCKIGEQRHGMMVAQLVVQKFGAAEREGCVGGLMSIFLWTGPVFSLSKGVSLFPPSQGQLAKAAEPGQGT